MENSKKMVLVAVIFAVIGILANKFYTSNLQVQSAQAIVDKALSENKAIWILYRSET